MPNNIINATSTGSGGLITTAADSGSLEHLVRIDHQQTNPFLQTLGLKFNAKLKNGTPILIMIMQQIIVLPLQ